MSEGGRFKAIVVGASAGAVEALSILLPAMDPGKMPPAAVVVHLPADRESALPALLDAKSRVVVKEGEDKERLMPGVVYFAPPDYHLLVEEDDRLSLSADEAVMYSRPSIDVLFESAADVYGPGLLGIVLTGANSDGAHGLNAVCAAGGTAWVQRPETAYCEAMPRAALDACPRALTLTLSEMADRLKDGRFG